MVEGYKVLMLTVSHNHQKPQRAKGSLHISFARHHCLFCKCHLCKQGKARQTVFVTSRIYALTFTDHGLSISKQDCRS